MEPVLRPNPGPGYAAHPGYRVDLEPCPKRVRVVFAGEPIADSLGALILLESRHTPVYYFPRQDVRLDCMTRTDHHSHCPFKGEASYWTISVGDRTAENALWSYEAPYDEVAAIKDHRAFYWNRMDAWYEEDEEVFVHARSPHVRIDVLESHRPVRVVLGGEVIAETSRARFLFETGLPVRYYIPKDDVRMELLERSESRSACPYKGSARYFSARIGGRVYDDIVWSYPEPLPEVAPIRDYLCFYNERVDALTVDGDEL